MHEGLPSRSQIEEAAELVGRTLPPTPQIAWPLLSQRLGTEVWVKHENHQPVGAFKVRGGLVYLDALTRDRAGEDVHIVSATRGNHGQSLAFAARKHGARTTIVVPRGNSPEKNAAMRALGAHLVEHGDDFTEAAGHAAVLAESEGWERAPSFHPLLIQGVATYWMEFFRAVPTLDAVFVPIGLGSGICAGVAARDALGLRTQLIGVVSSHAPAYARSFASGRLRECPVDPPTLADGVAVRQPDPEALEIILRGVERVVEVSDDEVKTAMAAYLTDTHNLAEGAAAAPLAAAMREAPQWAGKSIGLIQTGGNVDRAVLGQVLQERSQLGAPD
jgi:threonine dehydratase